MKKKRNGMALRWGFSTGACLSAVAVAAWESLHGETTKTCVEILFLDGMVRGIPLFNEELCDLPQNEAVNGSSWIVLRKDAGDDPDCTDKAVCYGRLSLCDMTEARAEDFLLPVGEGFVIVRCVEGIGVSTRLGLDCPQGKWAITHGPRRMLCENMQRVGLKKDCWLLEFGIQNGHVLAEKTLNPMLGVCGGLSLLGTTGLVRPFSHDAYLQTIRLCVKSHATTAGREMVFCTGGRTKAGAEARLSDLPEPAFTCIGDFIAESLKVACLYGMDTIFVACMAGKLCKYAAGFRNTHAHKVQQDMGLLRQELRRCLSNETALCEALEQSVSVREALLFIPESVRPALLQRLAEAALDRFVLWTGSRPTLHLLVFDFDGSFLFETQRIGNPNAERRWPLTDLQQSRADDIHVDERMETDSCTVVDAMYFLRT